MERLVFGHESAPLSRPRQHPAWQRVGSYHSIP